MDESNCDILIRRPPEASKIRTLKDNNKMRFHDLRLIEPIVRAVADEGYCTPTPIQSKAIPAILSGRDVLGCAQTGTGKTGAFALPILQRLAQSKRPSHPRHGKRRGPKGRGRDGRSRTPAQPGRPRALILSPTRELATQIYESFCSYGRNVPLRHAVIFGGVSQFGQVKAMRGGVDVIVATPGRLMDLMRQRIIDTSAVEILVLDEADHMLDMGFIEDIRRIIGQLPRKRQTLFFSATMPDDIRALADDILTDPVFIETDPVASTVETISQSVFMVPHRHKPQLLQRLIRRHSMSRTLVFTRTKRGADRLVERLQHAGVEAGAIHGNKNQNARTRALAGFKSGQMPVLVATDIAARGIDVANVSHVVNYDIPSISETYVHRIGRTARAGAAGVALSLCDRGEQRDLRSIERLIKRQLQIVECDADLRDGFSPASSRDGNRSKPAHTSDRRGSRRSWGKRRSGEGGTSGSAPSKRSRSGSPGGEGRLRRRGSGDDPRTPESTPPRKRRKDEATSRDTTGTHFRENRRRRNDTTGRSRRNRWLNHEGNAHSGPNDSGGAAEGRRHSQGDSPSSTAGSRRTKARAGNADQRDNGEGSVRKTWRKKGATSRKGRRKTAAVTKGRKSKPGKRRAR